MPRNQIEEYSFDYLSYQKCIDNMPVGITGYGGFDVKFYEICFSNNTHIYMFEDNDNNQIRKFINFMNISNNRIAYSGVINEIPERIINESLNNDKDSVINECKRLSDNMNIILYVVDENFKFSWQSNPISEIGDLIGKYSNY